MDENRKLAQIGFIEVPGQYLEILCYLFSLWVD